MSKESRKEYNFPPSPASDLVLRIWIDQDAFWAGVCYFESYICIFYEV
jgi:hypothetical protein